MQTAFPKPPFEPQPQPVPGSSSAMRPQADYGEDSYRGAARLKDKKVLLTGGDSGIGRAVALAYAREGADVVVSYLNEHEDAAARRGSWAAMFARRRRHLKSGALPVARPKDSRGFWPN
jgi:hypothetical protein